MKKFDKYMVIFILLLAAAGFTGNNIYEYYRQNHNLNAVIYKESSIYKSIPLKNSTDKIIKIQGKDSYNIIEIKDGKARVKKAGCPNKICVESGWLSKAGDMAVCIPNRVKVVIEGRKSKTDAVSY